MRKDFVQVVRSKGKNHYEWIKEKGSKKEFQKCDFEDLPSHQSNKHIKEKYASIDWSTIRRFLRSQVGKKFDDVNSVIHKMVNGTNDLEHEIRHAFDYLIETKTFIENDGTIHFYDTHTNYHWNIRGTGQPIENSTCEVYVDPRTQRLVLVPKKSSKWVRPKRIKPNVIVDSTHQFWKVDGIWYEYTFENIPERFLTTAKHPLLNRWRYYNLYLYEDFYTQDIKNSNIKNVIIPSNCYPHKSMYGSWIYPIKKRQINKRELKKFHLTNG